MADDPRRPAVVDPASLHVLLRVLLVAEALAGYLVERVEVHYALDFLTLVRLSELAELIFEPLRYGLKGDY